MRSQGRKSLAPFVFAVHWNRRNGIGGGTTFVAGAFKSLRVVVGGMDWQFMYK